MHRGGTSATAGALAKLGLSPGSESSLKSPSPVNPAGFWEQTPLIRFNDRLLEHQGGSWDGPPELPPGWSRAESLGPWRDEARTLFRESFPSEPWVWKDPRNCLLLEFWRETLELEPVVVLVVRNPIEIGASLERRESVTLPLSLALWERYMRSALAACAGRPVLVTRYEDLVTDPEAWTRTAAGFLAEYGILPNHGEDGQVATFVDPTLRHHAEPARRLSADETISPQQLALAEALDGLGGYQQSLNAPALGAETPSTAWLIAERRRATGEIRALKALRRKARATRSQHTPGPVESLRSIFRRDRERAR
jgi:hypothetical protein